MITTVCATRWKLSDILILRSSGDLVLWTGHTLFFSCRIKDKNEFNTGTGSKRAADDGENSPVAKVLRTKAKPARVIGIRESVVDRVNFSLSNDQEFRAIVRFEPIDCVARACVEGLRR
jgi:hypothetical protein